MRFHDLPQNLLDSKVKLKLLAYLFNKLEVEMSERELARLLDISNFSVNQLMIFFEQNNLVERRRVGATTVWRLKNGSYYYQLLENIFKRLSTYPPPIEHFKNLVLSSYPLKQVSRIYLYGSVAEGRENYNSDIDLLVAIKDSADKKKIEEANDKLRVSCLALYGNLVQILVMSSKIFRQRYFSTPMFKNAIMLYPEASR